VSAGSGGQFGANSSTSGVYAAFVNLREAIAKKLGFNSADIVFENGEVRSGNRSVPLAEAAGPDGLVDANLHEVCSERRLLMRLGKLAPLDRVLADKTI
ncbi:hypothetical protein ACC719_34700, partial [Rhizobium ruizarguesonis]